nr:MAG TPA: hypothetical protein [Caudoviricetes sp.]DAP76398.1 MAG TPA: hypothetical protein [Bacteriophage sp.]
MPIKHNGPEAKAPRLLLILEFLLHFLVVDKY